MRPEDFVMLRKNGRLMKQTLDVQSAYTLKFTTLAVCSIVSSRKPEIGNELTRQKQT